MIYSASSPTPSSGGYEKRVENRKPPVGKSTITFVEGVDIQVIEENDTSANDLSRFNLVPVLGVNDNDMVLDGLKNPLV